MGVRTVPGGVHLKDSIGRTARPCGRLKPPVRQHRKEHRARCGPPHGSPAGQTVATQGNVSLASYRQCSTELRLDISSCVVKVISHQRPVCARPPRAGSPRQGRWATLGASLHGLPAGSRGAHPVPQLMSPLARPFTPSRARPAHGGCASLLVAQGPSSISSSELLLMFSLLVYALVRFYRGQQCQRPIGNSKLDVPHRNGQPLGW